MDIRRWITLVAVLLLPAGLVVATAPTASAAPLPKAASCAGTYTIVVGGFNDPTSSIFTGDVSQRVGYSAQLNGQSAREGVNELNRLIRDQRAACPTQHAKIVGFSQGAAVAHTWVSENWQTFDRVNAVLISDPKRLGGPRGNGLSANPLAPVVGAPLAGVDRNFGNIPVVSLCTNDVICDDAAPSGWLGYARGDHVNNYDFNVDVYSNDGHGQWFDGEFMPW